MVWGGKPTRVMQSVAVCCTFFSRAEDGIRYRDVTGVQTCALPISTQTATVVVRGIALGDLTRSVLWRVLWKEMWLALATGAVSGFALATVAYAWKGNLLLSLILGVALIFNMLVAAVVGTLIPIALKAFRIDPASASSVTITTFTDVCGFFSLLGLATLLIR